MHCCLYFSTNFKSTSLLLYIRLQAHVVHLCAYPIYTHISCLHLLKVKMIRTCLHWRVHSLVYDVRCVRSIPKDPRHFSGGRITHKNPEQDGRKVLFDNPAVSKCRYHLLGEVSGSVKLNYIVTTVRGML